MTEKLYKARIINPLSPTSAEYIIDGAVLVSSDGVIKAYGKFSDIAVRDAKVIDYSNYLLMPGLIDTHVHLPQYEMVAMDGYELIDWLNNYTFPAEKRFESQSVARDAARRFFHGLSSNGTTSACVYSTVHKEATDIAFEEAEKSGLRITMGKVMMDRNSPNFLQETLEDSLADSEFLCKKWHGTANGRLNYAFTPRFAPTCSMELMKGCASLALKYGAYIQTHLSENPGEVKWVHELFPKHKNYTDVYRDAGLLSKKTIMAHCIYLEDSELAVLRNYSTKIAHCPSSNMFLKSGVFDFSRVSAAGLNISLGSDVGAGPNLSMFREMGNACNISKINYAISKGNKKSIDAVTALYIATLGGAKTLSKENTIGNIKPGKFADFAIVDIDKLDPTGDSLKRKVNEIASYLAYRADQSSIISTYVNGIQVYPSRNRS